LDVLGILLNININKIFVKLVMKKFKLKQFS